MSSGTGVISLISGPMVAATGMAGVAMGELVRVGKAGLAGEVIRIDGETAYAQVFESTDGMRLAEPMERTGAPLTVELGPGLLGATYDGVQRPLPALWQSSGDFMGRGITAAALDREKRWAFRPVVRAGDPVSGGDVLGIVPETDTIEHRILVPPGTCGRIGSVAAEGAYTVLEKIAELADGTVLTMLHRWPVKRARPYARKLSCDRPFLTGQRVLDGLFPIALGGTAIVPGGFGTGKTVVEQTLAKYCNADVIVYVGCGERGNEMADVLSEFPELKDPKTGGPLMKRTVLVVNTSNMPVAARDASVYTGITVAEYYRDQGYDVALMADSTSRWAEALREIGSRLEEMPGEEGYPTYLAARIAEFYERSGRVVPLGDPGAALPRANGSLTLVGAVSPAGGDFSEPVTQTSLRVAGALWGLDAALAYRRHYPAVNWNRSYSLYFAELDPWFSENAPEGWIERRQAIMAILQKDAELQEVVQIVGPDALQDSERLILEIAKLIRDVFLQQNAFSDYDAYSSLAKTSGIIEALLEFHRQCAGALEDGITLTRLLELEVREDLARLRESPEESFEEQKKLVLEQIRTAIQGLPRKRT